MRVSCIIVLLFSIILDITISNEDDATTTTNGKTTSGNTDMTLRLVSERECFPGFVCQHGTCSTSKNSCVCDRGWIGTFCQVTCDKKCGSNGLCDVSHTGDVVCFCRAGYMGEFCDVKMNTGTSSIEDTTEQTTSSLPASDADDQCPRGFPCVHGHCPDGQLRCVCQTGWTGTFCSSSCSLDCGHHGTCRVEQDVEYCQCEQRYTGTLCTDFVVFPPTSAPTSTTENLASRGQIQPPLEPTSPASARDDLQDDLRPLSERQCVPGFVCRHGLCVRGQLKCQCDEGWEGIFCQDPCTLDCGRNGHCVVTPAGQQCECAVGFQGLKCGSVVNITLLEVEQPTTGSEATASESTNDDDDDDSPDDASTSNTTLRPLSVRQCVPGSTFVCQHGTCYKGPKNQTTIIGSALGCVCDPGWIGVFCQDPCQLDCGDHGQCNVFQNGTVYCSCDHEYMGLHCDTLRPNPQPVTETPDWHWWVVGSCVFLLLLLLVLMIVLPYVLWKRRFIFIMKIVYMFQPFEDEDDKLFDAFVSYKSTKQDEDFVVHTLYPKLEKSLNFKLCLHFRDFMPGETIANNIIHAIENSRRTIMILTPSYIQSEFCRFEYQRAQHEMLKRKQRIIPIVLQDITDDRMFMDETLRTILDTITYIEWPTESCDKKIDKFWKRVELSMPKKRPSNQSNNNDNTSDAYNGYSYPMNVISDSPPDMTSHDSGHVNDNFHESEDDFHSIDINYDSDHCETHRNGTISNGRHRSERNMAFS